MAHLEFGEMPMQNVLPWLSETPGTARSVGPALGQHDDEIFGGLLTLASDQTGALTAAGVI
jgi:formyl-CoA transferase